MGWNAISRSYAILKTPSNDPVTATAVARTMIDMDPDHPLTRHLSVAYWKDGDEEVEQFLYDPIGIEKIVAWGGLNGIKHLTRYLQPGLVLVTLDPTQSSTILVPAERSQAHTLELQPLMRNPDATFR